MRRRTTLAWAAVPGLLALSLTTVGAAPGSAGTRPTHPGDGVVLTGLDRAGHCPGGYHVEDGHDHHADADGTSCSHGPDRAPSGVDVRDRPSTSELLAREGVDGESVAAEAAPVPCYGDGTSGPRLQAVYAVAADRPDRYDAVVDLVRGYAGAADQAYSMSAARDGGVRHLRWVTAPGCVLDVAHVVLSPTGDDSLSATRIELAAKGFNRTDRKYVVWTDATTYCGIAYVAGDSRPDATNPANNGPTYARIDSACWGGTASVAAHEIAHMLGAVNPAAPNSNGAWHCTDEYDRLCYDDGSGASLTFICASSAEPLLDCNGDDYFNVSPPAGSWLSTHWNLASSAYLQPAEPDGWSGGTAPPPAPAPTPTVVTPAPPSATPTVTPPAVQREWTVTRWQQRFTARYRVVRRTVVAAEGALTLRVGIRNAERVRVVVRDGAGRVVLDRRLRPGARVRRDVPAGAVRLVVRGRAGARVALRLACWTPT